MTALTIVNMVVLLALAAFTYFYMRHTGRLAEETRKMAQDTKRMADMMVQEFELKIAPILQIEKRGGSYDGKYGSQNFDVINKGSSPIRVARVVLEWWYDKSPDKIHRKEEVIDKELAGGEPRRFTISVSKGDLLRDDFKEARDLSLHQLRAQVRGRIHAICIDRNGSEHKTRDFPLEHPF